MLSQVRMSRVEVGASTVYLMTGWEGTLINIPPVGTPFNSDFSYFYFSDSYSSYSKFSYFSHGQRR